LQLESSALWYSVVVIVFMVAWLPYIHDVFLPDRTEVVDITMGLGQFQEAPDEEPRQWREAKRRPEVRRKAKINHDYWWFPDSSQAIGQRRPLMGPVDSLPAPQAEQQVNSSRIVIELGAPYYRTHLSRASLSIAGRENAPWEEYIAFRSCQVAWRLSSLHPPDHGVFRERQQSGAADSRSILIQQAGAVVGPDRLFADQYLKRFLGGVRHG
jgi:hypothetical protein